MRTAIKELHVTLYVLWILWTESQICYIFLIIHRFTITFWPLCKVVPWLCSLLCVGTYLFKQMTTGYQVIQIESDVYDPGNQCEMFNWRKQRFSYASFIEPMLYVTYIWLLLFYCSTLRCFNCKVWRKLHCDTFVLNIFDLLFLTEPLW